MAGLCVLSGGGLAGAQPLADEAAARHALDRLGFGPGPEGLAPVLAQGVEAWIEGQLKAPPRLPLGGPWLETRLRLPTLQLSPEAAWARYRPEGGDREAQQAGNRFGRERLQEARVARLAACVLSPRPLEERLLIAFNNQLHVAGGKAGTQVLLQDHVEQAIRPHLWGRFRDMLGATTRHPAMLRYLDNTQNQAPNAQGKGLNENLARELLELHTLGVHGGYTQADVEALAKALTGWGAEGGRFRFYPRRHLEAPQVLLGKRYAQRGQAQVEAMLDDLALHPATARRLALMLAQRFVADAPPEALVSALSAAYLGSGGQLVPVYQALVRHPAFWVAPHRKNKLKDPLEWVASTLRLVGPQPLGLLPQAQSLGAVALADPLASQGALRAWRLPLRALERLGGSPWSHPAPDGDPYLNAAWLGPEQLLRRSELALQLAGNRGGLDPERLMARVGGLPGAEAQAVRAAPPRLRAALVLAAPSLQWR